MNIWPTIFAPKFLQLSLESAELLFLTLLANVENLDL